MILDYGETLNIMLNGDINYTFLDFSGRMFAQIFIESMR